LSFFSELVPPAGIVRVLTLSNLAKTVGHGVVTSVIVLYFTMKVGIGADKVGLALSLGAALGMLGSVPLGHIADLYGPRNVTVGLLFLLGIFVGAYAFVDSFPWLVVVVSLTLMAESAAYASRGALIAGLIPPEERVSALSYMRSVANVGIAIGAAAGGIALFLNSTPVYLGVLVSGGLCFVLSGSAYLAVPSVPALGKGRDGPRWVALRDRPYLLLALLNTVLVMHTTILAVALPIWITTRTTAPSWMYSLVLILNTLVVVLLQVRVSKGSELPEGGAHAMRRSGLLLASCCVLFAAAQGQPILVAALVVLAGAAVHVFGEMLQGAGQWSVSFGLAPDGAQGQYQGLFAMSVQLGTVATPALAVLLLTHYGWLGWLILAAPLALAGLAAPMVVRWAGRAQPPMAATTGSLDTARQ
jgi:MFS family permease